MGKGGSHPCEGRTAGGGDDYITWKVNLLGDIVHLLQKDPAVEEHDLQKGFSANGFPCLMQENWRGREDYAALSHYVAPSPLAPDQPQDVSAACCEGRCWKNQAGLHAVLDLASQPGVHHHCVWVSGPRSYPKGRQNSEGGTPFQGWLKESRGILPWTLM